MNTADLVPVARLFGLLLGRELDATTEEALRDPAIAASLGELGLTLPEELDRDELAAEFFEEFISPQSGTPLVQSIAEGGSYEGDAAAGVRSIAEAAGLEWNRESLRGAPVDHLSTALFLWSELVPRDESVAREFAERHLSWAPAVLRRSASERFYGRCRHICADFVELLLAEER